MSACAITRTPPNPYVGGIAVNYVGDIAVNYIRAIDPIGLASVGTSTGIDMHGRHRRHGLAAPPAVAQYRDHML